MLENVIIKEVLPEDVMSMVSDEWSNMTDAEKKVITKLFAGVEK